MTRARPLDPNALIHFPTGPGYRCLGLSDKFVFLDDMSMMVGTVVVRFKGIHDRDQ